MDAGKLLREIQALDALEKRVRQTVNPSEVLLREIDKKRKALLSEPDDGKTTKR